jgi:hypothetical protein
MLNLGQSKIYLVTVRQGFSAYSGFMELDFIKSVRIQSICLPSDFFSSLNQVRLRKYASKCVFFFAKENNCRSCSTA